MITDGRLLRKASKALKIILSGERLWLRGLALGVAAGVEHRRSMGAVNCRTVVDIGANRGQFALAARAFHPAAKIISFEPLPGPAVTFRRVFRGDAGVVLHVGAVGPCRELRAMHITEHDDSSSLLEIGPQQEQTYQTREIGSETVLVAPLNNFLGPSDIVRPALLKLDVQGFESEALKGCEDLLEYFDWVYCECSLVELYRGQRLAPEIIDWLNTHGLKVVGSFNAYRDDAGRVIQADLLFERNDAHDSCTVSSE